MIEGVAAIVVADKAVKVANNVKKKEMGKMPDEIDELDLIEGALSVAKVATSGGIEESLETRGMNDTKKLPDEIGEGSEKNSIQVVRSLPDEIGEELPENSKQIDNGEMPKGSQTEGELNKSELAEDGELNNTTESETSGETEADDKSEPDKPQEKKGGSYRDVKRTSDSETHEVHHMPADSASDLERDDGPTIKMEKDDHRQTASCGSSREAREYRERQRELIKQGKFMEALQMDMDDIHEKFGDKYDDAIAEMLEYVDQLEKEGKING